MRDSTWCEPGLPLAVGRALVEDEQRPVLAQREALVEDLVLLPEREDARVELGEVDLG